MTANVIDIVSSLVYGDLGTAELGAPPAGTRNHVDWSVDRVTAPPPAASRGTSFLTHHVDVMLARYGTWRSKYLLPPVRPWDGFDIFPHATDPPVGPSDSVTVAGATVSLRTGTLPPAWTLNDLGVAVETYYTRLRNYVNAGRGTEMDDEVKAPFSYRYWAFLRWVADLRSRLLGQQVFPVEIVYDRDGTILTEKEFCDFFHQTHHVWHPNAGTAGAAPSWTDPTPGFATGVGQHRRKKEISRTQVGAEFFAFHRDHLVLFDRWLARTKQDPVQSINTCSHDTGGAPAPPPGLDIVDHPAGPGYPIVNWSTTPATVDFNPVHATFWNGPLGEFASVGEMGQFFALDFNPFGFISIAGASDSGYHGIGHVTNGDLAPPVANNFVPRFFAWHGFIDDLWAKRQPRFTTLAPVLADGSAFTEPRLLTILREFATSTDSVEPANAVQGIDLSTGQGTLRCRIQVRPDSFNRPLDLLLRCEVLREASGPAPVITLTRSLTLTAGPPGNPNERQQNIAFVEDFVFDGSPGTVDNAGKGPFAADNLLFPPAGPAEVGFTNSLIRVVGYLTCRQRTNGTVPAANGTVSSAGTTVSGSGTVFQTLFRQGDLIRAAGQVRMITGIASNTSLTVLAPFSPALSTGTSYERLDGFDHEELVEIPLVQEKQAPQVAVYLNRSSFSKDQVDAVAVGGQSSFEHSFYLLVQDRTARPAAIVWPPDVEPQLYGLIAPRVRAAGLYHDLAHAPTVELRDAASNASLAGQVDVAVTAANPEDPSLHPSVPQRITYNCRVTFTGNGVFAGMAAGDVKDMKLVVTATDRAGNRTVDDSSRVRLQINANPYMLDGPVPWLSVDTRVLQVREGQARFGVPAGWTDPNAFVAAMIDNLRNGGGTAGGESFDGLPEDQPSSALEYSTQVGGVNVHNFALAKVRLQSATGALGVRTSFRLLRWGTANVAFDSTLTYRSDAASGIALLGRTTSNELASIPFFAAPRVGVSASMTAQTDTKNVFDFPPTGGAEATSFFGAYLDINHSTLRFPAAFIGDGGFGGVPPADMRSIRDLLISQHQCMVVEIRYPPDPITPGATPGTSDNLSQRNLLILRTANPGSAITRSVQHSFDIDLTRRPRWEGAAGIEGELHGEHGGREHVERRDHADDLAPPPARPASANGHGGLPVEHWFEMNAQSWLRLDKERLEALRNEHHRHERDVARWQFDPDQWKSTDGLDELVFFWNDLPTDSIVELVLPGANVEEIVNYRNLRHAPETVGIVDSHTLRLTVAGPTYLPVPAFWGEHLAGLATVTLPSGIEAGERFVVDVLQLSSEEHRVLGGFQLNIQVAKAIDVHEPERRLLEVFHQRLSHTPPTSRWRPVLERQLNFIRDRARGFVEQANDPDLTWKDPTTDRRGRNVRLVVERIQILDDQDPFIKGAGEFRFRARVVSRNNGELRSEVKLPAAGHYRISDREGRNTVELDVSVFEGFIEDHLAVEICGIEMDTFDPDDTLCRYRRVFTGPPAQWLGAYGPGNESVEPEDLGDWRLWYRLEWA